MVEARIFVNKIPIYGDQHKAYTIMSRLGNILPVIRSSPLAGLCYDTPSAEARPFPVAMLDNPPRALSEDFYQEKLPSNPLIERFSRKICLL